MSVSVNLTTSNSRTPVVYFFVLIPSSHKICRTKFSKGLATYSRYTLRPVWALLVPRGPFYLGQSMDWTTRLLILFYLKKAILRSVFIYPSQCEAKQGRLEFSSWFTARTLVVYPSFHPSHPSPRTPLVLEGWKLACIILTWMGQKLLTRFGWDRWGGNMVFWGWLG